ncbi:MAG: hypothetical protein ACRCZ2_06570 [Fusobacteriaceae bacterium]
MGICKKCGSNYIVKSVKKEIMELYYPGSEVPDRVKRDTTIRYKCKDCGRVTVRKERV